MTAAVLKATNTDNLFAPPAAFANGIQGLGAASVVLQTYAQTLVAQPDIQIDVLPTLPADQKRAREAALQLLNTVNPATLQGLVGLKSFANQFDSYNAVLLPLARAIDGGDRSQLPRLIQGLQQLLATANQCQQASGDIVDQVDAFAVRARADNAAFTAAERTVEDKIEGDKGEIATLRAELAELNRKMDADITQIAVGAVSDIAGIALVVVGVVGTFATEGVAVTLVGAGIGLVAGGTTAMAIAATELGGLQQQYAQALTDTVKLELQVAAFDTLAHQINAHAAQSGDAVAACQTLSSAWGALADNLQTLIRDLQNDVPGYLAMRLQTANQQWKQVGQQVDQVLSVGNLPFKRVPALTLVKG